MVGSPIEELRNVWKPASVNSSDQGYQGFYTYCEHVTKFRPSVSLLNAELKAKLGGHETIRLCDVAHPKTPRGVVEKAALALKNYISDELKGQFIDGILLKEHQPPLAKEAIGKILGKRLQQAISASQVLVLAGSSTQWLDLAIKEAISTSIHNDYNTYADRPRMPVVLAPAGSFKCGGFFPYTNGGKLVYIPTRFENNYKLTAEILKETIQRIEENGTEVVSCLLLETPTALGQNFTLEEIAEIGEVIAQYPHILWVQDGYNLGTEHDGKPNPSLASLPKISRQGCTIYSFRRDWGGVAPYANVSAFYSLNNCLVDKLALSCSQTSFYGHLPFTGFQKVVTDAISQEMVEASFAEENQPFFKKRFSQYVDLVDKQNQQINSAMGTDNIDYLKTIPVQSGQFGFLFFNKMVTDKAGIDTGTQLAELMCICKSCRVFSTLLEPMGIGKDPVGIRLNIALREDSQTKENARLSEALERIGKLTYEIAQGIVSYSKYSPAIQEIRKGKEANIEWVIHELQNI